jgi:hypothetical protein
MHAANSTRQKRWRQLSGLLSFVAAFVVTLGWGSSAFAAVPMCGIHAQTIAAPPIGTPTSTDSLNAENPCTESAPLRAAGIPNREAPEKLAFVELQVRALPVLPRLAPSPLAGRSSAAAAEHEICATGFARSIYRPPRA